LDEHERALLDRVQVRGSRPVLASMSDAELTGWVRACERMTQRASIAAIARRTWKHLLDEATTETVGRARP